MFGLKYMRQRREALLKRSSGALAGDIVGAKALCNLALGVQIEEANEQLRAVAQWFVLPHPKGRDPYGECDFAAIKLTWAYYRFGSTGLLESATLDAIREYFLRFDFQSKYTSENHRLLFHTSRYLMACAYPEDEFGRYGMTGKQLIQVELDYLLDSIRFNAKRGWDEFDSGCYLGPGVECLLALADFAPDAWLRLGARMMMNLRLTDLIHESLEGMYCGAHGRIYERHALDHRNECSYFLQHLYFGNVESGPDNALVEALLSDFTPEPILERILTGRGEPYEVRERVHENCSTYLAPQRPLPQEDGSLRKLTYMTPDFALGTVQWQDAYEPGSLAAWRTGHQQMDWDLTFAGGDTRRRVFTQHPGHNGAEGAEHGYWTGDLFCDCNSHFQSGPVSLSIYDIPAKEPYQLIHAYFPGALFDRVVEGETSVFAQTGKVYFMLQFSGTYRFTTEGEWAGREIICPGSRTAVALEVGTQAEFGTFDAFISAMRQNRMAFDPEAVRLCYESQRAGTLILSRGERLLNGQPADLDYATYDSPYLSAPWDSGIATITFGDERLRLDFNTWQMTAR